MRASAPSSPNTTRPTSSASTRTSRRWLPTANPPATRRSEQPRDGVERHTDRPVRTLTYRHGNYSAATIACLERSGLAAAVTVQAGPAVPDNPRFELPRYEIKRRDTLPEFLTTIALGLTPRRRSTVDAAMKALHISRS